MNQSINIALIEDSDIWRALIKCNLQPYKHFNISMQCLWGDDFFNRYQHHVIDLILLDISLPGTNGYEVALKIKKLLPGKPIVVFSSSDSARDLFWFSALGVKGYISKVRYNELGEDLNKILGLSKCKASYNLKPLSYEDIRLIHLVCEGLSNREIALELNTVEKNVEYRLKKICDKIYVPHNKLKIMEFAAKYGYW